MILTTGPPSYFVIMILYKYQAVTPKTNEKLPEKPRNRFRPAGVLADYLSMSQSSNFAMFEVWNHYSCHMQYNTRNSQIKNLGNVIDTSRSSD